MNYEYKEDCLSACFNSSWNNLMYITQNTERTATGQIVISSWNVQIQQNAAALNSAERSQCERSSDPRYTRAIKQRCAAKLFSDNSREHPRVTTPGSQIENTVSGLFWLQRFSDSQIILPASCWHVKINTLDWGFFIRLKYFIRTCFVKQRVV